MKKILSISVIAMMAAAPAFAAREVTALGNAPTVTNASSTMATASFVTGAYDAVKTQVNNLITDTNVTTGGNYIDANETVAHNLAELDTAVKSLEGSASDAYQLKANSTVADKDAQDNTITYNYISSGTGVAANLVALDTRAKTNADAISTEAQNRAAADTAIENKLTTNGGANGYEINAKSLQVQGVDAVTVSGTQTLTNKTLSSGTLTGTLTATDATISGGTLDDVAIDADDNTITNLTTTNLKDGVLVTSTDGIAAAATASDEKLVSEKAVRAAIDTINGSATTLSGRVDTLEGQMGNVALDNTDGLSATTVTQAINELQDDKQEKSDSNVATAAEGTYTAITAGTGVGANLVALDSHVKTIENKQIPIVSDWSTGTVTNTKISQLN